MLEQCNIETLIKKTEQNLNEIQEDISEAAHMCGIYGTKLAKKLAEKEQLEEALAALKEMKDKKTC